MAKQLSISRSPVREALRRLVADRLVVEIPNKGVFVREFTPRDIQEVFDVRVILESYALQHIYENLTPPRIEKLLACVDKLKDAYVTNNLDEYIKCDTQLHNMIIHQANNALIESIYAQVAFLMQQFRSYSLKGKTRFDESVIEHEQIVNFALSGDSAKATAINCRHLELARDEILKHLMNIDLPEQSQQ